jgi:hypothetical protein
MGDGLRLRPTRSRNSRPELIADDENSVILPARSSTLGCGFALAIRNAPDRRVAHPSRFSAGALRIEF